MTERTNLITFKGNPLTLVGNEVKLGDTAPDFTVLANDLSPVNFSSFAGKPVVISSVPSLDTPICDMSTRRFNEEAIALGSNVAILTISMDLPFAQARWCGASDVKDVITLSDHRDASFGLSFGLLIKELRLLARAVFVIDKNSKIQYIELVPEIAQEPNYEAALEALKKCK